MLPSRNALLGLVLLSLAFPLAGGAQERAVVSKEIAVGKAEAALRLEFADGARLALALSDGSVMVDGESVGSYAVGDPLEAAWRALLGEAVLLDDGPLASMLRDWTPPASLEGEALATARRLDQALEAALSVPATPTPPTPSLSVSVGEGSDGAIVRLLLGQTSRLATLGEALEGLGSDINLHLDEDVVVAEGETITGNLLVVQGDVRVAGIVSGDVVVVDGTLKLLEGGLIQGDARLVDATFDDEGGVLQGELRDVERQERNVERELRDQLREELRSEIRREIRSSARDGNAGFFNPFSRVFRGIGAIIENLVAILILGMVGMGVVAFAPLNLDVVAETARRSPGRSAMVGLAGTFLLVPVWVLGAVALAVSIVGIPVMIAWLPLFPLAAVAAAGLGYLAMARNVGEWLADTDYRYTDWIRKSNPVTTIFGGLAGLMIFFVAANVLGILPFFGFFKGLLTFVGVMASLVALQVGFGAVLLTRAGRRPEYYPKDFDEAWAEAVDAEMEMDAGPAAKAGTGPAGGTENGGNV